MRRRGCFEFLKQKNFKLFGKSQVLIFLSYNANYRLLLRQGLFTNFQESHMLWSANNEPLRKSSFNYVCKKSRVIIKHRRIQDQKIEINQSFNPIHRISQQLYDFKVFNLKYLYQLILGKLLFYLLNQKRISESNIQQNSTIKTNMFTANNTIKSAISLTCWVRSLYMKSARTYIKQKQIDEMSQNYGQGKWEKIKLYSSIFKHISFEGLKGAKNDAKLYQQLKEKRNLEQQMTEEEIKTLERITNDIYKLGPLIIIQILPFSGPLFMLYMYTYPGSIPSWFMIDYYHDRHEELKISNHQKTLKLFQQRGTKPQDINLETISLPDLKKLCLLLFGFYRDGTVGYRKLFNKKLPHFVCEGYSRYLIKRDLSKRFKRNIILAKQTQNLQTLQEKVQYLYGKIMRGEHKMVYQPMYEHTLEKMQTNKGKESDFFGELSKGVKNPNLNEATPTQQQNDQSQTKDPNSKKQQ